MKFTTSFILFLFVLISLTFSAQAIEAEKITLELNSTRKVTLLGCTKSMVVKAYLANVKINPDGFEIQAKNVGNSYIYIWSKEGMKVYNLYVNPQKEVAIRKTNFLVTNRAGNFGKYNLVTSKDFTDSKAVDKNLILEHYLYYKIPSLDGNLEFSGFVKNNLTNLNTLNYFGIKNLAMNYSNPYFNLDLGNISSSLLESNSIKGFNFAYNPTGLDNFRVFSGFNFPEEIVLYNDKKDATKSNVDKFLFGFSSSYNSLNWLNTNLNFLSELSLKDNTKKYVADFSYKVKPSNNFSVFGNVKSNFSNLFSTNNLYLKQNLFSDDVYFEENLSHLYQKDFVTIQSLSSSSRINYKNDIQLSATYGNSINETAKTSGTNLSLKLSKAIVKDFFNVYGQYDYRNLQKQEEKAYQLGGNLNLSNYIPMNLAYNHNYIFNKGMNENFDLDYRVFTSDDFSLNLTNNFSYSSSLLESNKYSIYNTLSVASNISIIKEIPATLSLSYINNLDENKKQNDKFAIKLDSSIRLDPSQQINFQISSSKTIDGPVETKSSVNYNFLFGELKTVSKGNISGAIFQDDNSNGILDPEEKAFPNIKLTLDKQTIVTDQKGNYEFKNLEYANYELTLDNKTLPQGYKALTETESVTLDEKEKKVNFLVNNKLPVKGVVYANKNKSKGMANIRVNVDNIDSLNSDDDGFFSVKVIPGLHVFQVDYNTIPKNYTMVSKISQKVEVSADKEQNIEFILNPIRIIKGLVHSKNDKDKTLEGIKVKVTHYDEDEVVKTEEIVSDEDGEFSIEEFEGDRVEIKVEGSEEVVKTIISSEPFNTEYKFPV